MDAVAPMSTRRLVAILFVLGALVRGVFVVLPLEDTICRVLTDDAFYNLQVAEHFFAGEGATFDGRHPTNGYHPLWMILCWVPLQLEDPVAVTRALLAIASLVDLLGAWLLFRTLWVVSTRSFALSVLALWLLNPTTVGLALNGLDTPLVFCLTTAAVGALLREAHEERPRRLRTAALFAAAFLARVDVLILAVLLGGYRLLECWRGRIPWTTVGATAAILLSTVVPYFAWNRAVYDLWTPASGLALGEHLRHASGLYPAVGAGWQDWISYFGHGLGQFLPEYLSFFGAHGLASLLRPGGAFSGLALFGSVTLVIALIGWLVLSVFRSGVLQRGGEGLTTPASIVALIPLAYFAAYLLRLGPKTRYLLPALVSIWWLGGLALRVWPEGSMRRRIGRVLCGFALANCLWGWVELATVPDLHGWTRRANLTRGLSILKESVPDSARIGAFNSGVYAFFSKRPVVNLDGLINNDAYFAIRDRRLVEFIVEDDIDYVLDLADQIQLYLAAFGGLPLERFFERFEIVGEFPLEARVLRKANQRLLLLRVKR